MAETYDPLTLQVILQQLPEIERRKKAAERLRGAQSQFQALEQKKGSPHYQPTQQGGLYPTVARYQKDYSGAANQLVGAIGGYMADREANKADTSLSEMRNQEIIGAVQGMGQQPEGAGPDVATDRTLRAYLGMLGGPEVSSIIGKNAHRSSQVVEKGTGELINMMSDGSYQRTGIYPDPKRQILTPEGEPIQVVDLGGSGAGSGQAVKFGVPGESSIAAPPVNPNAGAPAQTPPAAEDEAERWYQAVESVETGGEKDPTNATSPVGAKGPMQLMPPTARELEKALGLPEGSTDTDPKANRKAGRVYLDQRMQARNGDRSLALMDYNWGQGKVDKWLANPNRKIEDIPQETRDYVQKVTQRATGGSPPSAPSAASAASAPSGTRTIVTPTAAQKAGASEAAKIAAQNAAAPQTAAAEAQVAGAKSSATEYAKNIEDTRFAIPRMESAINTAIKDVDALLNDKALDEIIGGSVAARVAEFPTAAKVYTAVMAGTPKADAMAKYSKVMADAFKNGFEALKGGGPVSDREGQAAQDAEIRAKQSQSPAEFRKAMADWKEHINAGLEAKRKFLRGEYGAPGGAAPAAARPALPQGFSWGD